MSHRVTFAHNVTRPGATIVLSGHPTESQHNLTVDPGFANATSLALSTSSPLRDLGLTLVPDAPAGAVDYLGNPRVQGGAIEPGAYELVDARVFGDGFE